MVESHRIVQRALVTVLVLTFMYESFDKTVHIRPANNLISREKSLAKLEASALQRKKLRLYGRRLFKVIVTIHFLLLCKYLMVAILHLERFKDYRYLDCYVMGRMSFSSKTYLASIVVMLIAITYSLFYRFYIKNRMSKHFNYELFSFLLLSPEEVLWNEIYLRKDQSRSHKRRITNTIDNDMKKSQNMYLEKYSMFEDTRSLDSVALTTSTNQFRFYLENPFRAQSNKSGSILLRLNRTSDAWHYLKYAITVYYPIGTLILLMIGFLYVYFFILKTALTTNGYYVNYSLCVGYIKSLSPELARNYSYIIDAFDFIPPSQSIPSSPQWNYYHILRFSMDIFDNLFIYTDSVMAAAFQTSLMLLQVIDLSVYIDQLGIRLTETLRIMRYRSMDKVFRSLKFDSVKLRSLIGSQIDDYESTLDDEDDYCVTTTQAYLLDYMRLVGSYGVYAIFQTSAIAAVWLIITAGTSFWLGANRNLDLQGEFRWAQVGLALLAIFCMSVSAYLESKTRQLYKLISVAMAIDPDVLVTKERWCDLSRFFYPKPMYCFAFFERSEISWLFCMKVSSLKLKELELILISLTIHLHFEL